MQILLSFLAVAFGIALASSPAPGSDIRAVESRTLLGSGPKGSQLYQLNIPGSTYDDSNLPVLLFNATETSNYDAGYDLATLLAKEYISNFNALIELIIGSDKDIKSKISKAVLLKVLDKQYAYLGKALVSTEFEDELQGMKDGSDAAGYSGDKNVGLIAARSLVITNLPSDLDDMQFVLADEHHLGAEIALAWQELKKIFKNGKLNPFQCSNFGVWGSRTVNGQLFSGRNLDWAKMSGCSNNKLITISHPPGGIAHASLGFAGLFGSLTGISAKGLTVHEANLESNDETFLGFPWMLSLRYVMARTPSGTIDEAMTVFNSTQNTVGFNLGFGSAVDAKQVLLETMAHHTAMFSSLDGREVSNGGDPRKDAVYRTNHGFDSYTIEHYMWNNTGAYKNSMYRYALFPQLLDQFESKGTLIDKEQAVEIVAIVGDKGEGESTYQCAGPGTYGDAQNIMSVAFQPNELIAYVAYENGDSDANWSPAGCNTYIAIDLKEYF
jgi:hypothetical protein